MAQYFISWVKNPYSRYHHLAFTFRVLKGTYCWR